MSVIISVGIVLLAMLIIGFLQLSPGIFAIFSHYSYGKYSKKRASFLGLFFILGAETIAACFFLSCFYLSNVWFLSDLHPEKGVFAWVAVGVLIVLSAVSFFLYYRNGTGTRLFISRKIARVLDQHARNVKTRSDAFILGAFSGICELVFTLPLYIISAVEIIELNTGYFSGNLLIIFYILTPTIPLFVVHFMFNAHYNLADIARMRVKDKAFIRFMLTFCYITIAVLIICHRINLS